MGFMTSHWGGRSPRISGSALALLRPMALSRRPILVEFSKTSDTLFAYQAIAGFRYMFTPSLALDLDYRYRGSSDATWKTRAFTLNGVNFPSKTFSGSTNTNNVVASLTWLFVPRPP